jgi:Myb-like DNA-binding domain
LINAHSKLGSKWSKISEFLPGRTGNAIKNHWNATKRKNLAKKNLKHTWLQDYIATCLNPKRKASKRAPLQTQPTVHNLNSEVPRTNSYYYYFFLKVDLLLIQSPNFILVRLLAITLFFLNAGAPTDGYPFFRKGPIKPAFLYNHSPTNSGECSGSSAGRALICNQDIDGTEESSEVIFKKPHCSCDKGKRKVGLVRTCSI